MSEVRERIEYLLIGLLATNNSSALCEGECEKSQFESVELRIPWE